MQLVPMPVSLSLLSSVHYIYKGCWQHGFCPCEGYSCHTAPVACHHLLLSSLLPVCLYLKPPPRLANLATRNSDVSVVSHLNPRGGKQSEPSSMDGSTWIQNTSSNKMALQTALITVNRYCLLAWCKTSTDKTKTIKHSFGTFFCPLHL